MTVLNRKTENQMAKRQKTDDKRMDETQTPTEPSVTMKALVVAIASRTPDMNRVDICDTISDVDEIIQEQEPLKSSDLPPRPAKHKKRKSLKESTERRGQKQSK